MGTTISPGSLYPTWFSDNEQGLSTVIDVFPYTGSYKHFTHVLRLSAPRTMKGWMEMAVDLRSV